MLKHLEKQHELLVDARQSLLDALHKYQIEEEMLMRKLHEVMSAHDKRKEGYQHASADAESRDNQAIVCTTSDGEVANSSIRENGKHWAVSLLSVACISVAAKMEELKVPVLSDYPLGGYMFDNSVIQRMELLVLSMLEWKMACITPFAYFSYFIDKFCEGSEFRPKDQLMVRATGFVKPSSLAAAAILAALDIQFNEKALEVKLGLIRSQKSLKNEEILSLYSFLQEMEKKKRKTPELDILPSLSHRCSPLLMRILYLLPLILELRGDFPTMKMIHESDIMC